MNSVLSRGFRARPAAITAMLLALAFLMTGCRSSGPDPSAFNTPPLNAYALSGGKITHFIPEAGLLADPVDESTLEECRQLPITSGLAKHGYVIVQGRGKTVPVTALVVDKYVLVTVGEISRVLNIPTSDNVKIGMTLFPGSPQSIILRAGDKYAQVGPTPVKLNIPMYWAHNGGLVMTLPDIQRVFDRRSAERGGKEFKVIKITYHLTPGVDY